MNRKEHWDNIYAVKADHELSWTQAEPEVSLSLIQELCPPGRIIDVGGGASRLADRLLDLGYSVTVLDVSEAAVTRARERLGARSTQVDWIVADITSNPQLGAFDLWHDRAVFHFLTEHADREGYVRLLSQSVVPGGHAVIATFAEDGPDKCSGLPVCRYSSERLVDELGKDFVFVKGLREMHLTPWGKPQSFQYGVFRRVTR